MTVEAILASCIVAIGHGNSVESCLAAHPEYADRLEPLLRLVAQAHNLRHSQTSHATLIEAILASCIEVIESVEDEKSVGYFLDDYTGYADRLEPLLRALAELYSLPERRMARAALVHARAFVARAERKRWSHMAQTALTIVPPIVIRVSSAKLFLFPTRRWGHVPESPASWRLSRRIHGAGMSLAVTAASIVLMVALVLNTAALSLPGDVYYPIKRGSEEVQGMVVKTFGEPAAWHMGQVERRVRELTLMEKSGRSPDPTAVAAVEAEVKVEAQAALANAVLMPELQREKLLKSWSQQLKLYQKSSGESSSVAAALAEPLAIVESVLSNPDNAVALVPTVTATPDATELLAIASPAATLPAPNVLLSATPPAPTELNAAGGTEELQPSTTSNASSTEQDVQPAAIALLPTTARPRPQATATTARPIGEPVVANTPSALSIAGIDELLGPGPIPATPTGEVRLALQTPTSTLVAESPLDPVAMVRATATSSEATSPILLPTVTNTPAPVSTATARPTITPTSSRTPLATNTPRPTATPNATATPSPTELLILVPTATPASTLTPTVLPTTTPAVEQTATALPTETPILLPTATETPTETPTAAASATLTPTVEATATSVPTETATDEPTVEPTATVMPTETPTVEPTATVMPTETPTVEPTATSVPTETPTVEPTATELPTETPISEPTDTPLPTETPTPEPTDTPLPTETPTPEPTDTLLPTETPTPVPTDTPLPTETPTPEPTDTSVPSDTEPPTETATVASADTSVPPDTEMLTETPEPELTDTPVPPDPESPTETAEATDEGEPDQSQ
ncbi:MAG: hypothetical protein IT328_13475 [Caldilineaceae bacterium]|nr:hypothetical protein [Caldilineaceae bacterium]